MDSFSSFFQPEMIDQFVIPWLLRVLATLVIWFVGKWVAKRLTAFAKVLMEKGGMEITLVTFLGNVIQTVLLIVVLIAALDNLGVKTTSMLAMLGAAGLAIGLALKDSLSNFSSGIMLILFRPFKVGDFIEAAGVAGTVEEVRIFATVIRSADNRLIVIPNSLVYGGTIINFSAKPTRRIDLVFGIGYGDDLRKAKDVIARVIAADSRILLDPAPLIALSELADSSVNLKVRPWVATEDYWKVHDDMLEKVKLAFDAEGISIPFPQRDVHVHTSVSA